jgi:F-type H+-transporting ATPase subunit b
MKRFTLLLVALLAFANPLLRAQSAEAHGAGTVAHETAHPAEEHGEGKTYLGIPAWILKLINMVVFLGVLGYLLAGPVKKSFEERKRVIRADLAEAATRREKADRLAADIAARMSQLEHEVASILERATEEGERQKREMIAAGEHDAERVLAAARSEIDARVKLARTELASMATEMTTDQARAIVTAALTDEDRRKIFGKSMDEIGEMPS